MAEKDESKQSDAEASDTQSPEDKAEAAKQNEIKLWQKENLNKAEIKKAMSEYSPEAAKKEVKKITPDEIKVKLTNYSADDIKRGAKLLKTRGYITVKDFKQMKDNVWTHGFFDKIDDAVSKDDKFNPFLYWDRFDFKGGIIEDIIYNMDIVKSRKDALKTLADVTKKKVVQVQSNAEDKVQYK